MLDAHVVEVAGVRVGLVHDLEHLEHRTDDDVAAFLDRCFGGRVHVAVSGHSHIPSVRGLADGTALVNPGSPTMPYGYLGLVGTIGLLEIHGGCFEVTVLDLATGEPQLRMAGPGHHPLQIGPRPSGGR